MSMFTSSYCRKSFIIFTYYFVLYRPPRIQVRHFPFDFDKHREIRQQFNDARKNRTKTKSMNPSLPLAYSGSLICIIYWFLLPINVLLQLIQ